MFLTKGLLLFWHFLPATARSFNQADDFLRIIPSAEEKKKMNLFLFHLTFPNIKSGDVTVYFDLYATFIAHLTARVPIQQIGFIISRPVHLANNQFAQWLCAHLTKNNIFYLNLCEFAPFGGNGYPHMYVLNLYHELLSRLSADVIFHHHTNAINQWRQTKSEPMLIDEKDIKIELIEYDDEVELKPVIPNSIRRTKKSKKKRKKVPTMFQRRRLHANNVDAITAILDATKL